MNTATSRTTASTAEPRRTAGAFDIRVIIASLFVLFGIIVTAAGVVADDADIAKAAGINVNLDAGIGMLVFAGAFIAWARLRPITVSGETSAES